MANKDDSFKAFASEVRGSYDILLTKLKAIKMSTDEAKMSKKYANEEQDNNTDALKLIKLVRPQTPKNISGLFRAVAKDIYRIREASKGFPEDLVKPQDRQQLDRVIQDLERHLHLRAEDIENLKTGRLSGKKPKSARAKSARAKSAKRRPPSSSLAPDSDNDLSKTPSLIQIDSITDTDNDDRSTPRRVLKTPVISTKVIKQSGQKGQFGLGENKEQAIEREYTYKRERTWGAFHGQKTLSQKGVALKLPTAHGSQNLVSQSASQFSDSDSTKDSHEKQTHDSPEVKLKRTDLIISERDIRRETSKMAREQNKFQAAKLTHQGREKSLFMPNPRRYARHDIGSKPVAMQRQFTNLDRAGLNDQTNAPPLQARRYRSDLGIGRTPSYLVNRSRTVPDVQPGMNPKKLPKSVVAFGRSTSFQELPPLASLKRGFSGLNNNTI